MHVHETTAEIDHSLNTYGMRPVARLAKLGLLGPGLIAVHGIHLDAQEIALFAQHGCHVAHCPSSNLKLASGIAPVRAMLEARPDLANIDMAANNEHRALHYAVLNGRPKWCAC